MSYTHEKVYEAVHALMSPNLSVQERLQYAGVAIAKLRVHPPTDPVLAARVEDLLRRFTAHGSIPTTTAVLNDASAEALVTDVLTLFEDLGRADPASPFGDALVQAKDIEP